MLSMDNLLYKTIESYFDKNSKYEEMTLLSNTSAIIYQLFKDINWVGFYIYKNGVLHLGPFQGKPACMLINLNSGVCGYSARNKKSIIVDNVHEFEGHIACDSASNSELVVPIIINNELYGVLDIDSPNFSRFSNDDLILMENVINYISNFLK